MQLNYSNSYEHLTKNVPSDWVAFNFSEVKHDKLAEALNNFPLLSDVFLDGNDKL